MYKKQNIKIKKNNKQAIIIIKKFIYSLYAIYNY